jgi:hypothetical protein
MAHDIKGIMFRRKLFTSYLVICLALLPAMTYAGDPLDDTLSPRAEVSVKAGSERSTLTTEFWAPLAQQSGQVVYTDLRLMGDDDDNREGNLGFGYRQVTDWSDSVLGGHMWVDQRRTENNSTFHQLTFGAESLGNVIDLRANGYIPLSGSNTITTPNIGTTTPYLAGSGIYVDGNGTIVETPQYGADAEIGYRIPILEKQLDTLRIYGGGYSFFRNNTESVTGFRVRTEAVINPALSVGARFQHDGPRGSQGFLEATLRFPFTAKKMYQQKGLYGRLDESPERDIDIVTSAKVVNGLMKPLLNPEGTPQQVLYVDNTAAANGNGTKDHPFDTLAQAQAALKANDILYIAHGDGTTTGMDQGITISQNNITLIGSGSAFTFDGVTLINAGIAPTLTSNATALTSSDSAYDNSANVVLVKGDNALITGITATGAAHAGIAVVADAGQVINNVTINNNTTTNSGTDAGIVVKTEGSGIINNATISNNISTGNVGSFSDGIFVRANAGGTIGNVSIANNTTNNNNGTGGFGSGIAVWSVGTNSSISNVAIINNGSSNNGVDGVNIIAKTSGMIDNVSLSNITTNTNTVSGLNILAQTAGRIGTVTADTISSSHNTQNGFSAVANGTGSAITSLTLSNSITSNNAMHGIFVAAQSSGTITNADIMNNTSNNNTSSSGYGIEVIANGTAFITHSTVTGNTTTSNTQAGLYFSADVNSILSTSVSNNKSTGNGTNGLFVQRLSTPTTFVVDTGGGILSSVGQNSIHDNIGAEVRVDGYALNAHNNYWGGADLAAGEKTLNGGATVTTTGFLATDPHP